MSPQVICKDSITKNCKRLSDQRGMSLIVLLVLLLHLFNCLVSRTTWASQYQKGKTSLDLGWQWHQLDLCKRSAPHCRQITTPTPHHSITTDRMLFRTPNQQCQSTEGNLYYITMTIKTTSLKTWLDKDTDICRRFLPCSIRYLQSKCVVTNNKIVQPKER